jgi:hypothetical protein
VKEDEISRACSTYGGRRGIRQKKRHHWEEKDIGGWIILKWILERWDREVLTGLIWLRRGTNGGLL